MAKIKHFYRGAKSKRFWKRINALKNSENMYRLGVRLQNLEEHVLEELLRAEGEE